MPKKRFVKAIVLTLIICFALGIGAFLLIRSGAIIPNASAAGTYPVQGVDVSSYQGKIDWAVLADQNLQFAFIKATEGSSAVDPCFRTNYQAAKDTDLRIGAYHFFSYDSAGKTQAENFISVVPADDTLLPPVVDVEFYGNYAWYPPERETVRRELDVLLALLEAHYGKQPILYATEHAYRLFLSEGYSDYDIWIRDVFFQPSLSDGRDWTFWQYTDRAVLDGYAGDERFIDRNVFYGSQEVFDRYARTKK